jgi:hypothetical protein
LYRKGMRKNFREGNFTWPPSIRGIIVCLLTSLLGLAPDVRRGSDGVLLRQLGIGVSLFAWVRRPRYPQSAEPGLELGRPPCVTHTT